MNNPADTLAALAPCPFCGGAARVIESRLAAWSTPTFAVGCEPCNMVFCENTRAESIAAWNRRASLKGEAEPVGDVRDYGPVLYCQLPPGTKLYTTPPAPQAVGEALVDRIAYALAAHEVWGGQITPDEALKDEKMRDECYSRAELVAEMIATHPSPAPQGGEEAADGWPDYVMLRDTNLHDDQGGLGQRIFTTAGAGYKKVKYVRADLATPPAQQPGEVVTDEMVERAASILWSRCRLGSWSEASSYQKNAYIDDARAALTAALAPKEQGNG